MPLIYFAANCVRRALIAAGIGWLGINVSVGAEIDAQRELFQSVYESVERGDWSAVDDLPLSDQQQLRAYVLWPDLRAAWFRATLNDADDAEIESYLRRYGVLRPARELRYRYALHVARTGDLAAFLTIYQQFYQGLEITKLDCLALHAELAAGRNQRVVNRAIGLWMVGKSQIEECDYVFAYLTDNHLLSATVYRKRFDLAIDAREFSLAQWLAKSIDQRHVDIVTQWRAARSNAESFVRRHQQWSNDESVRAQLVYAIKRLTYGDPVLALELWTQLSKLQGFSAEQKFRTERHIALWTARDNLPGAYTLLSNLPVAAQNDEVLRWRARSSLRDRRWMNLQSDIARMSTDERETEEWRYWNAIALRHNSRSIEARQILTELALERSYYGFLAADELNLDYALHGSKIQADESIITQLADRPDLIRARELFLVGLEGRGRSEWDTVVSYLLPAHTIQAAKLANRWGWHSRAISTAASAGQYDDLTLRYPLPYRNTFREHAEKASISPTWAYSVARSESLFMRDVRSSAGAIGLMQLMPTTGRAVAKEIRLPYSGLDTLTDPHSNIRLGTTYLAQMAERYGGNRVPATAAYNAGPHRVDRWLPASGDVDARVWIENIPFNETREYVRRVMAAETIFHWRITGEIRRLTDELLRVEAFSDTQQLARTN